MKTISKIVGAGLAIAMALGIGVAASYSGKESIKADAVATYSLTPDKESTGRTETSYITSLTEFSYSGVSWKMNQWNPNNLQIKANQSSATGEFRFYNTSAFSAKITKVEINFSALTVSDASKLMFLGGTSEQSGTSGGTAGTWTASTKTLKWEPASTTNYTYFAFYQNGKACSGTNYLASEDAIVVTYDGSGESYNVTYSANTHGTGSFVHQSQPKGSYALLPFSNLTGVSADSGYVFDNYTVGSETKNPGDTISLASATNVAVNFKVAPPEVTFVPTDFTTTAGAQSKLRTPITISTANGIQNTSKNDFRVYANNALTISASTGYNIVKVTFDSTGADSGKTCANYTADVGTYNSPIWTGTSQTIVFSCSVQVQMKSIVVEYEQTVSKSISITTSKPLSIGLNSSATLSFDYANLTTAYSITSSDGTKVRIGTYTGATGTGSAQVTLYGDAIASNITVTVSSGTDASDSITVSVEVLPIVAANFNSNTWGGTTYATSPHTFSWNSSYNFIVSAGQLASNVGYLGTNNTTPSGGSHSNAEFARVNGTYWTLQNTGIDTLLSDEEFWSNYGQAIYMSNFGVVHPTQLTVKALNSSSSGAYLPSYALVASTDGGSNWTLLSTGTVALDTDLTWSGNTFASISAPVQFGFVTTYNSVGTLSNITFDVFGDSYAPTKVLQSIYVSGTPKTSYYVGEEFDLDGAEVYAKFTDSTTYPDEIVSSKVSFSEIVHRTTEVTISYLDKTTTVSVTVSDVEDIYKKVTSPTELLNGSKVVIGVQNSSSLMGIQAKNNRHSEPSESNAKYESGGVKTYSVNTAVFTIGIVSENESMFYTFKDKDNNYLTAVSSSNNYLHSEPTLTDAGKWVVAFGENGAVQITTTVNYETEGVAADHTKYMGESSDVYGCYLTSHTLSIFIDVENNISVFETTYMHTDIEYDPDPTLPINNTGDCNSEDWYVTAKAALISMGQDYIDEFTTNDKFEDAYDRYMAWARACGDSSPFEGDGIIGPNSSNILFGLVDSTTAVTIIVVVSMISLTSVGAFFVLRKRKENI